MATVLAIERIPISGVGLFALDQTGIVGDAGHAQARYHFLEPSVSPAVLMPKHRTRMQGGDSQAGVALSP